MAAMCDFFLGNVVGGAMMIFYTDYIGLGSNSTYGIAIVIFGFWNMINDPIFAYLSDKRIPDPVKGKRKPVFRWAPPVFLIGFFILVLCPRDISDMMKFFFILGALFIYDLGIAALNVNIFALLVTITKDPNERAVITMLRSYIILIPGGIAGLFPSYLFTSGFTYEQILFFFILIAAIFFVFSYIPLLKINEPASLYLKVKPVNVTPESATVQPPATPEFDIIEYGFVQSIKETFKSKTFVRFALYSFCGAMMTASYYDQLIYIMKWVYHVTGIYSVVIAGVGGALINIFYLVANKLRQKYGIIPTLYATLSCTVVGYIFIFVGTSFWHLLFGYSIGCLGFSTYWLTSGLMLGDVVDEDYITSGKNRQAMFGSILSLVTVPASSMLILVFSIILDEFGYDGKLDVQSDTALLGLRIGVGLLRVLLVILTMIMLAVYPLKGQRYIELREKVTAMETKRKALAAATVQNTPPDRNSS
jgi:GPH family glycoside/pentoside/hexuronide:cation symporter